MIIVTKIDEKNFSVNENDSGLVGLPAVYAARETENNTVILEPLYRHGRGYQADYTAWNINGAVPTSATEAIQLLNAFVGNFKPGGGATPPTPPIAEWHPHPDWWDIEAIFKADTDINKRFIMLITDSANAIRLDRSRIGNTSAYYKTSDGETYNAEISTHTWDNNKDKKCKLGYKTRYVTVYSTDKNVRIQINSVGYQTDCKYIFIGNQSNVTYAAFGGTSSANSNLLLEATHYDGTVTLDDSTTTYTHQYCYSLQSNQFPKNMKTIRHLSFGNCSCLTYLNISNGVTTIEVVLTSMFATCYALTSISIPQSLNNFPNQTFSTIPSLISFNIESGWIPPSTGINLSGSRYLSVSSMINILERLGATASSITITFGTFNLQKLQETAEGIAAITVATNKGYTMN